MTIGFGALGGGGGGGVNIPINIPYAQAMTALNNLTRGVNTLNSSVNTLQGRMNQAFSNTGNGIAGRVAVGAGAFFVLRRAASETFNIFKEGVGKSAELEQALARLQSVSGATDEQISNLSKSATKISGELGPTHIIDVVHNMEALNRIVGASVPNIEKYAEPFSKFTDAIMLTSGNKVSSEGAATMLQQMLSAFGGLNDPKMFDAVVHQVYKAIAAFAPEDPATMIQGIRAAAPALRTMNLPLDQTVALAAFRQVMATGGMRASGRDIESLVVSAMDAQARLEAMGPKKRVRAAAAMEELGMTRGGMPAIIDPRTGAPDVMRLFSSLNTAILDMQKKLPANQFYPQLIELFKEAFPEKIGRRIGMLFSKKENLEAFAQIMAKIANTEGMEAAIARYQSKAEGQFARLGANLENVLIKAFDSPRAGLGKVAGIISSGAEKLAKYADESDTLKNAMSAFAVGTFGSILTAIGGVIAGRMAGWMAAQTFFKTSLVGQGMAGGTELLAGTLFGLTRVAGIASVLGLLISAGIIAYKSSPAFANAVDQVAGPLISWLNGVKEKVLNKAQELFPPPSKATPEGFVGPPEPWFSHARREAWKFFAPSHTTQAADRGLIDAVKGHRVGGLVGFFDRWFSEDKDQTMDAITKSTLNARNLSKDPLGINLYGGQKATQPSIMDFFRHPIDSITKTIDNITDAMMKFRDVILQFTQEISRIYNNLDAQTTGFLNGLGATTGSALDAYRNPPPAPPSAKAPPASAKAPDYGFANKKTGKAVRQQEALTGRALMQEFTRYLNDDLGLDMRAGSPHRTQSTPTTPIHQR